MNVPELNIPVRCEKMRTVLIWNDDSMTTHFLSTLQPGQSGVIRALDADPPLHQRLLALGFRIGKRVEVIRRASMKGPVHIRIGTTDVMMRTTEARRIELEDVK